MSGDHHVRPISDLGMKDYFSDTLKKYVDSVIGSYDAKKKEYNVTIRKKYHPKQLAFNNLSDPLDAADSVTVSYSESSKGWTSFKSFKPEYGLSLNNDYYTFYNGQLYKHHDETSVTQQCSAGSSTSLTMTSITGIVAGMVITGTGIPDNTVVNSIATATNIITASAAITDLFLPQQLTFTTPRNTFYGTFDESYVTLVFNDNPTSVKSFNTINYEGTQSKVTAHTQSSPTDAAGNTITNINDNEYYNLTAKAGWYVDSITTNKQTGSVIEFKDKECKWFGAVCGDTTEQLSAFDSSYNIDESEFSVQGLGIATWSLSGGGSGTNPDQATVNITFANNVPGTGSTGWDTAAVAASEARHWTVAPVTQQHLVGSTITEDTTVDLVITPIINGVHSGYNLTASNFTVSNDDTEIKSVAFTDLGTAGDPANTVRARITLNAITVSASDTILIDIDEDAFSTGTRNVALRTTWAYDANHQTDDPDVIAISGITTATEQTESATPATNGTPAVVTHIGTVSDNTTTKVAEINFTANSGYHYTNTPSITMMGTTHGGYDYSNAYTTNIETTVSSNRITAFNAQVFYTPPQDTNLLPDPPDMINLSHIANINYNLRQTPTAVTNTITHASYSTKLGPNSTITPIYVYGIEDTQYKIQVVEMSSTTSNVPASSNAYYNFDTNLFAAFSDKSFQSGTIGSDGKNTHWIQLPNVTTTTRYDIVISSVASSTIGTNAPSKFGDASITQYGTATLTIKPVAFTAEKFPEDMPADVTVSKVINFESSKNHSWGKSRPARRLHGVVDGATSSSTTVKLTKPNPKIMGGMYVLGLGTGAHGVTVTKVLRETITLSAAQTIADGTTLRFIEQAGNVYPFSFTIDDGSRTFTITSSGRQPDKGDVALGGVKTILTNGAVNSSATVVLDSSVGVIPGMTVEGEGIPDDVTVSAIAGTSSTYSTRNHSSTTITLSEAVTVADNTSLTFSNSNNVKLLDIEATLNGDNQCLVKGLIQVDSLGESANGYVYVENFINSA